MKIEKRCILIRSLTECAYAKLANGYFVCGLPSCCDGQRPMIKDIEVFKSDLKEELLPCPFCGSKALLIKQKDLSMKSYGIVCQNEDLDCNVRLLFCDTEDDAIKQWNRRVNHT